MVQQKWAAGLGLAGAMIGLMNIYFAYQNALNVLRAPDVPPTPPTIIDEPGLWVKPNVEATKTLAKRDLQISREVDVKPHTHHLVRRGVGGKSCNAALPD